MDSQVIAVAGRGDLALSALARTLERVRRLEDELRATFDEWTRVQAQTQDDAGVVVDVELTPPLAAAFAAFKMAGARQQGRQVVAEVYGFDPDSWPIRGEVVT